MGSSLTPTSYAILGLLTVDRWTTYELARQMDRALGQFWPRAESKLYEEPKKLVAHGLARATTELDGNRRRTVYSITPKGRRALAEWLPTPGAGPIVEFEQLIKVFFAEHGTKADLLSTLEAVRDASEARLGAAAAIPHAYLAGNGPFPERLPWLLLVGQFLIDFNLMVEKWAEWASAIVAEWPDDVADAQPDRAALERQANVTRARRRPS
jgi:PadR family transcriptional regulator AphA